MTSGWSDEQRKALIKDVDMLMGNTSGPNKSPSHYFPLARVVQKAIEARLLAPIAEQRCGEVVIAFLRTAMDAVDEQKLAEADRKLEKNLNSARAMLEFTSHKPEYIDSIVAQYQDKVPSGTTNYTRDSVKARRLLAQLEQKMPMLVSEQTARSYQNKRWAPAVVDALHDFMYDPDDRALALARSLGLLPANNGTTNSPQAVLTEVRSTSIATTDLSRMLARSAELRESLRAQKVLEEVQRDIVDKQIVSLIVGGDAISIIAVRGDAGAGKTVIAGQTYDALKDNTNVIVIPCQIPVGAPITVDDFDAAFGAQLLLSSNGLVAGVRELAREADRPVVVIFDTIDAVLDEHTFNGITSLFRLLVDVGAQVIFTCRRYDYDIRFWSIQGRSGVLAPMLVEVVDVPRLNEAEIRRIVRSYLEQHSLDPSTGIEQFAEQIWMLSKEREPLRLIVTNPLLLVMLCETFAHSGNVPVDLTTTRLCRTYHETKIAASRKYNLNVEVSREKRMLWLDIAGELWRRSKELIVLGVPETWLDDNGVSLPALDDLLSEDVLVRRSSLNSGWVQFNHQFLAEYSMAIYLLDKDRPELDRVLDELHVDPNSRWFAWQVIRHVLARAASADIPTVLARIDLANTYAFQAAVSGLVERSEKGYLIGLVKDTTHYDALLSAIHFVVDTTLTEAYDVLTVIIRRGSEKTASRAARVAGELAIRSSDESIRSRAHLVSLLNAITDIRDGKARAKGTNRTFSDQLLENLFGLSVQRKIVIPSEVLARARKFLTNATPVGYRIAIRAHLVESVSQEDRRRMLERLLSYKEASKVGHLGIDLIAAAVKWDLVREDNSDPSNWDHLHPIIFLTARGKNSRQLRAQALASAAAKDLTLQARLVEVFATTEESETGERVLMCLQEAIKVSGQQWIFEHLKQRTGSFRITTPEVGAAATVDDENLISQQSHVMGSLGRLCGLLKGLDFEVSSVRHAWADWFSPLVVESMYQTVDAYLQIAWDAPNHLTHGIAVLQKLAGNHRDSIVANLARKAEPGKAAAVNAILDNVAIRDEPLLRMRLVDIYDDNLPAHLIETVASPFQKAAAQAMKKLGDAARAQRPWITPELLEQYASHLSEKVRVGVLKSIKVLVDNKVGDLDRVVATWLGATVDRHTDGPSSTEKDLVLLIKIGHTCLRTRARISPATLRVIEQFVEVMVASIGEEAEIRRELFALIKTLAAQPDEATRRLAAGWTLALLGKIDVSTASHSAKEALENLIKYKTLNFEEIVSHAKHWKRSSLELVVQLIVKLHPEQQNSALLDELSQADEGSSVRSLVAFHRLQDQN